MFGVCCYGLVYRWTVLLRKMLIALWRALTRQRTQDLNHSLIQRVILLILFVPFLGLIGGRRLSRLRCHRTFSSLELSVPTFLGFGISFQSRRKWILEKLIMDLVVLVWVEVAHLELFLWICAVFLVEVFRQLKKSVREHKLVLLPILILAGLLRFVKCCTTNLAWWRRRGRLFKQISRRGGIEISQRTAFVEFWIWIA